MDIDVCCIIAEAKCCSARFAAQYVDAYTTGTDEAAQEAMFKVQTLNGFIKTLYRHQKQKELFFDKKEKCVPLGTRTWIRYHGVCLQGDDLLKIIESIKLLCVNCNCNCN